MLDLVRDQRERAHHGPPGADREGSYGNHAPLSRDPPARAVQVYYSVTNETFFAGLSSDPEHPFAEISSGTAEVLAE